MMATAGGKILLESGFGGTGSDGKRTPLSPTVPADSHPQLQLLHTAQEATATVQAIHLQQMTVLLKPVWKAPLL